MAYALRVDGVLALAASIAIATLGLVVLRLRPRSHASVAFSVFALVFGATNATATLSWLANDPRLALAWGKALVATYLPVSILVVEFALSATRSARSASTTTLRIALAMIVASGYVAFASAPGLFVAEAGEVDPISRWVLVTPLFGALTTLNYASYAIALWLVARRLRIDLPEQARSQLAFVLVAFLILVSGTIGEDAALVAALVGDGVFTGWALVDALGFALRVAILATVLLWVLKDRLVSMRETALVAAILPGLTFMAEALVPSESLGAFTALGIWRLIVVGLLAYAIARHRMFDLELKLHAIAPLVASVAFVGMAVLALWSLYGGVFRRSPILGLIAALGVIVAAAPLPRVGRTLAHRAFPRVAEPDYLYQRKIQLYRAALEEANATGAGEATQDTFLTQLRRSLRISEEEHRLLVTVVQARTTVTRFRTLRELGRGSFGRAILAHDLKLDRRVVLKQVHAPWLIAGDARERLLVEARAASRVKHANVVTIHDVFDETETPTLVMEYVEGGNLEDALRARERLPLDEAAKLVDGILAGLAEIHRAGIVHRDLKPANVLLAPDGTPKIADFGVALPPPDEGLVKTLGATTIHPGSLAYMSPEQAAGQRLDGRSDLYAVGAILYRALTGRTYLPVHARDETAARAAIRAEAPDLSLLPAPVAPIVARALAKEPGARFADAGEMRAALSALRVPSSSVPDAP